MPEIPINIVFPATIVVGLIASILAFYSLKHTTVLNSRVLKARAVFLYVMAFGFALHTAGDFFGSLYGQIYERMIESISHVVIFIIFFAAMLYAIRTARKYGGFM